MFAALAHENPLLLPGVPNALVAKIAQRAGFSALYLSGGGMATQCFGIPDLGMTSLEQVCEEVRRITAVCDLPLLVDADTGFGAAPSIARTVKELIRAGAKGLHIEDQVQEKRCGHRPGKAIVSKEEMASRLRACLDARGASDFFIMARTDAFAVDGLEKAVERALYFEELGADGIFPEALTSLEHYKAFTSVLSIPVLANITEFGKTPLFSAQALGKAAVRIVLYPQSINRMMNKAAETLLSHLKKEGCQEALLGQMLTRKELYDYIDYDRYEALMDTIIKGTNE